MLKGEVSIRLRASVSNPTSSKTKSRASGSVHKPTPTPLDAMGQARFDALKAWRGEVAKSHNLPAYVIFHDATLAAIAKAGPADLDSLQGIAGIGVKKLEAYGQEVLRVVATVE